MKNNPLVSVIVVSKNSSETIGACLLSIKNQNYPNIELILVDNKSKDNTILISRKYTDTIFNKGPERSAQRNYGAIKSTGDFVCFIDSDMELEEDVVSKAIEAIKLSNAKILVLPELSIGFGFWAKCKALERSFYLNVDWMEAARFFDSKIFKEFNGFDEENTGTEDFDLPQRIKTKYGDKIESRIDCFIKHNERNLSLYKTLRKKFYYAQNLNEYKKNNLIKLKKQSSILQRYSLFFKDYNKLFKNPIVGIGMLFMKTSEFIAGGFGYLLSNVLKNKK
jgi:glycosyltransferase involved in cell wall biosynthesis